MSDISFILFMWTMYLFGSLSVLLKADETMGKSWVILYLVAIALVIIGTTINE